MKSTREERERSRSAFDVTPQEVVDLTNTGSHVKKEQDAPPPCSLRVVLQTLIEHNQKQTMAKNQLGNRSNDVSIFSSVSSSTPRLSTPTMFSPTIPSSPHSSRPTRFITLNRHPQTSICANRTRSLMNLRLHPYKIPSTPEKAQIPLRIPLPPPSSHSSTGLQAGQTVGDGLIGYFNPEISPAEEFLWRSDFFGHRSLPQLTYTLVYLLGKILGIRTGPQLRQLRLDQQLKLFQPQPPVRNANGGGLCPSRKLSVMPYELLYAPGPETNYNQIRYENGRRLLSLWERAQITPVVVVFDHIIFLTQKGFVINHCTKNNHQRCLVCLHALLLKKRVR